MKTRLLPLALFCLGGCASSPYGELGAPYEMVWSASSSGESVLEDLSSLDSYQANPTDQHFCDAMCQYARHVESNRLIAEARRREQRQRLDETETAFDEFFEAEPEIAESLPPVVIHQPPQDVCVRQANPDALTPVYCH